MKMVFKIDTGEMIAYGTGDVSQWSDTTVYYTHVAEDEVYPGNITYTYDGENVIEGDPIALHDLTGS
jgi:hypothetical protein